MFKTSVCFRIALGVVAGSAAYGCDPGEDHQDIPQHHGGADVTSGHNPADVIQGDDTVPGTPGGPAAPHPLGENFEEPVFDSARPFDITYFQLDLDRLASAVDWRAVDQGRRVTPVKHQGRSGTCVAFAATAAMESAAAIQQGKLGLDLSEQWLVESCGTVDPVFGYATAYIGDDLIAHGMVAESDHPYQDGDAACPEGVGRDAGIDLVESWRAVGERQVKAALAISPVIARMAVYTDFDAYRGGVYRLSPDAIYRGGHAVLVVGYDDVAGAWLIKNSWGATWGESGFAWVAYNQVELAQEVWLLELEEGDIWNGPALLGYLPSGEIDADRDGFPRQEDCDDNDPRRYPGAPEACNGIDDDCDLQIDEDVTVTWYRDADGDGFGTSSSQHGCSAPNGYVGRTGDCDDGERLSYPGAPEVCDGRDNDCDGDIDENVATVWYLDVDGDGYGNPASPRYACEAAPGLSARNTDCNDSRADIYPGAAEKCDDVDQDCDGQLDEGVQATFYRDADGDGYGNAAVPRMACSAPAGYVTNSTDCNDGSAATRPNAAEVCDGADNDCDASADEGGVCKAQLPEGILRCMGHKSNRPSVSCGGSTVTYQGGCPAGWIHTTWDDRGASAGVGFFGCLASAMEVASFPQGLVVRLGHNQNGPNFTSCDANQQFRNIGDIGASAGNGVILCELTSDIAVTYQNRTASSFRWPCGLSHTRDPGNRCSGRTVNYSSANGNCPANHDYVMYGDRGDSAGHGRYACVKR